MMMRLLALTALLLMMSAVAFANIYPAALDNGMLVLVDGGMGVGRYADRSSVSVERYEPPFYQIAINVVPVTFSDDYWRQHDTYVGGPYTIGEAYTLHFRYYWGSKSVSFRWHSWGDGWRDWDINRDNSHAEGEPLIPYTAEVAFVSAYNIRFFDGKTGYSPVLKGHRRVIDESLYRVLGI